MANQYIDGTYASPAQHGDVVVSYPLSDVGDNSALMIRQTMRGLRSSRTPLAQGSSLAGFSGSRLVREYGERDIGVGVVEFIREFATVPAARTGVLEGSSLYTFPAYTEVIYKVPADVLSANDEMNLYELVQTRPVNNVPGALYIDYNYFIEGSTPVLPEVFRPTLDGNAVDFVTDGRSESLVNAKAADGEFFTASYTVPATVPSLSAYASGIGSSQIVVDVQLERYMGDIFVMKTFKMDQQ